MNEYVVGRKRKGCGTIGCSNSLIVAVSIVEKYCGPGTGFVHWMHSSAK